MDQLVGHSDATVACNVGNAPGVGMLCSSVFSLALVLMLRTRCGYLAPCIGRFLELCIETATPASMLVASTSTKGSFELRQPVTLMMSYLL